MPHPQPRPPAIQPHEGSRPVFAGLLDPRWFHSPPSQARIAEEDNLANDLYGEEGSDSITAESALAGLDSVPDPTLGRAAALIHQSARRLPITPEEKRMAKEGDIEGFWRSRQFQGDPIADIALASLHPGPGFFDRGRFINDRLNLFSILSTGHPADIDDIRRRLMMAHVHAVESDKRGVPGLLNSGQIYDYHQKIYEKENLPSLTFGATPITGSRWEAYVTSPLWCAGCDK